MPQRYVELPSDLKLCHFGLAKFARMPFAVEENALADPIPISFFCAWTEVPTTAYLMNLIHQAGRCGNGGC